MNCAIDLLRKNKKVVLTRTSLLDSDPKAKMLGTNIEKMIVDFLKSDGIVPLLNNEP